MLKAVIECLRFDERAVVAAAAGPAFFHAADRAYLTPAIAARFGESLTGAAKLHAEDVARRNAHRHQTTVGVCREIAAGLTGAGIDFVFLKGITQTPWYCDDLAHRPQFDVDIYCPGDGVQAAQARLIEMGFSPLRGAEGLASDHTAPLIRRTAWRWREDYYDLEMPLTVELHHSLWNREHWGFSPGEMGAWWERRTARIVRGEGLPALHDCDGLAYSAWHLLRHLLNGDLRPYHVYEIAHFMERSAEEDGFWAEWQSRYPAKDNIPAAIAFRVASDWFGCRVHPVVSEALAALPESVTRWFQLFGESPLASRNKDALLLHLCLVESAEKRWQIAMERLLPMRMPPGLLYENTPRRNRLRYCGQVADRAAHHLVALGSLAGSALRWSFAKTSR